MPQNIPALPAGFQLESTPPLPAGFQLERAQETTPNMANAAANEAIMRKSIAQSVADEPWYEKLAQGAEAGYNAAINGIEQHVVDPLTGDHADAANVRDAIGTARAQNAPLNRTVMGAVGNMAGGMVPLAPLLMVPGLRGVGARAALGAATGALAGYVQPSTSGGETAANTVLGGALGGVPTLAGAAARRIGTPVANDIKAAAIAAARKYGIPLHVGQVMNSPFVRTLSSVVNTMPLTGAARAADRQQTAFNRAVGSQFGAPLDAFTERDLSDAQGRLGNVYDDIFDHNDIALDPQAQQEFSDIAADADRDLGKDADIVRGQIGRFTEAAAKNGGRIPGRTYQNIMARVRNAESGAATPGIANAIADVRQAMQGAAERSVRPGDYQRLLDNNAAYNSLKIAQKAITKRAAGARGDIQPSALWSLTHGKYGATPAMKELAGIGQVLLKDPVPQSGTPMRFGAYGALGTFGLNPAFAHTTIPVFSAGAALGHVLNSPWLARAVPATMGATQGALLRAAPVLDTGGGLLSRGTPFVLGLPRTVRSTDDQ